MTNFTEHTLLDNLTLVKIDGVDAETFLQGQFTNDVKNLQGVWQWNGYCNPKGRLLATMFLWRNEASFYMLLDQSLVEPTIKRLRMYVMRSKVELDIISHARSFGELSPNKPNKRNHEVEFISPTNTVLWLDGRCIHIDSGELDTDDLKPYKDASAWLAQNIEQGLPWVNALTVEHFIPQMINFDALQGISFKKGCYTGQEIVARMHYLGKLKQRMFLCDLAEPGQAVNSGDKIVTTQDHRAVGTIVNSQPSNTACLAVLRLDAQQDNVLQVVDSAGIVTNSLTVRATQPYALPTPKQT